MQEPFPGQGLPSNQGPFSSSWTTETYRLSEIITVLGDVPVRIAEESSRTHFRNGLLLSTEDYARLESWRYRQIRRRQQQAEWHAKPGWLRALLSLCGRAPDFRTQREEEEV